VEEFMKKKIGRRSFLQASTAGIAAAAAGMMLPGTTHLAHATSKMFPKPPGQSGSGSGRVVIIGAGWGGLSTARLLKKTRPETDIVIVEQNPMFMSCPLSNLFLGGVLPLERLQFSYAGLGRQGIRMIQERVTGVDRAARTMETSGGKLEYDLLVMSPGIDYMWDAVPGLWDARFDIPIAFRPGAEHLQLKRALDGFQGGTFVLAIPEAPIRCPPGPYERIAMIAYNFKKRGLKAKLVVLDANPKPMSKADGFLNAYKELYPDIVEYHASHKVESVDGAKKRIVHSLGEVSYDAANIIPPMQAGAIVREAGLGPRWAEVNPADFSSKADPNVYLVGDVIGGQPFPKSGFMANMLGRIVAQHVAAKLDGKSVSPLVPANVCYSMVDGDQGGRTIWVSNTFTWNEKDGKYENAMKTDLVPSHANAETALNWAETIWNEMLG
jgi:NADPH-dependent 2,4-dienoyl-CoA reductase/sulfur reductase-like enzyme